MVQHFSLQSVINWLTNPLCLHYSENDKSFSYEIYLPFEVSFRVEGGSWNQPSWVTIKVYRYIDKYNKKGPKIFQESFQKQHILYLIIMDKKCLKQSNFNN